MQSPELPTILIVSEWHTPIAEVETFVEGLIAQLSTEYNLIVALRLHDRTNLPLITSGRCQLHHFKSASELKRIIKHYQPRLIHFQQSTKLAYDIAVAAKFRQTTLLMTLHYGPVEGEAPDSPFPAASWKELVRLSHFLPIVCTTPELNQLARDHGLELAEEIISVGIDAHRYQVSGRQSARAELGLPSDKTLVLYTGDARDSRYGATLKAMAGYPTGNNVALITTAKPKLARDRELVAQLSSRGRYSPLPDIDRHDTRHPMLYQAADIYSAPSLRTGNSLPVLEALATGLPVVAPDQLATTLTELEANPNLRARLTSRSRSIAEMFQIDAVAQAYNKIYILLLRRQQLSQLKLK